ncbi:CHAP domain-containing protein [Kribbella sp. NPDC051137]|uniref:CHAP domain-containing protein n=1 Tax=Kribbella sp. NPDC051137 TaxID=3155045 RepID=UPI002F7EC6FA
MRTALMRITARVAVTALLAGVTALGTGTLTASAATGTVVTDSGTGVAIRSGNATSFGSVGTQPNGTVEIDCQIYGEPVTGKYGRSLVWDHIPGKGYITDSYVNTGSSGLIAPLCTSNPRADNAIAWYAARSGSTAYQGYCEKAAENSYGKTAIWASAMADWNDAVNRGVAHKGDLNPPKGALVFWNLAAPYGHVGVATGDGNFWATSVSGAIGKRALPYFNNYLGWAYPNF